MQRRSVFYVGAVLGAGLPAGVAPGIADPVGDGLGVDADCACVGPRVPASAITTPVTASVPNSMRLKSSIRTSLEHLYHGPLSPVFVTINAPPKWLHGQHATNGTAAFEAKLNE